MIDLSYLKTTTNDDYDVISEVIRLFVLQLPDLKENILNSYENKNWRELKEAAHKAKNSFEILGVKIQAAELKRIEILAMDDKFSPEFEGLISNFVSTCEIVLKEIDELKIL